MISTVNDDAGDHENSKRPACLTNQLVNRPSDQARKQTTDLDRVLVTDPRSAGLKVSGITAGAMLLSLDWLMETHGNPDQTSNCKDLVDMVCLLKGFESSTVCDAS